MTRALNLGGIRLPLDFCTKTAAILAQRRKGKTYTASVIAEEMVAAKQPFVALDPTGAWWGLRAGADGTSEGLPVVVLGGQHGDIPLERTGGKLVADLVVEEPGYYVIDFSLFESGQAERQFAIDFAERLYRAKGQPGRDFPLHLFVDEADRFVPQQLRKGSNETSAQLLGAFEAIVRRGGIRGLGTTLISQRAAVVNKNVLEMLDVLIALRTVGPNDRGAIAAYIEAHGTEAERSAMLGSLAGLDVGEAWIWEPGADPALFERIRIRRRHTFNSSATPKAGEKRVEPKRLAAVEIATIERRMAATIERAKADDPKELRRQLAASAARVKALEVQLAKGPAPAPAVTKTIEIPVLSEQVLARLEKVAERYGAAAVKLGEERVVVLDGVRALLADARAIAKQPVAPVRQIAPRPTPSAAPRLPAASRSGDAELKTMHRSMLIALAQHPDGLSKGKILLHTGYRASGPVSTAFADLNRAGWVEAAGSGLRITSAGLSALGPYEPLPTGDRLREELLTGPKLSLMERKLLQAVCDAHPEQITKGAALAAAGYASSGPVSTAFARLKQYGYVHALGSSLLRASEELFG